MKILYSALLAISATLTATAADPANFVFTNGKVYTVNMAQPWAEAVAVSGKKIVYVGDNAGAKAFVGKDTVSIDLKERLVLPGLVESHIHIGLGAGTTTGVILGTTDSIEQVLEKVKTYAAANPEKKTIFGASYLSFIFDEKKGPPKELLDKIVPDRPVFLMDHTLHAVWVNSKAYEVAGVTKDTPNPPGGEYMKNEKGELSGWIKGAPASLPVLNATKAITAEGLMTKLPDVLEGLTEFGFTSAMDMGMPFAQKAAFDAFAELDKKGKLPIRLSMTYYVNTPALADGAVAQLEAYSKEYKTEHFWFDTLKITADSVVENQKAALLEPYLTTGNRGTLYFDHEALNKMILPAAKKGFNITIHTIGDWAARVSLDSAQSLREAGYKDTLFSTTHSQIIALSDRSRYKELNVTAQTTGNWAVPIKGYPPLIGQKRNDTLQLPFATWAKDGVNIALGSDWPATPGGFEHGVSPFNNMFCAMHRRAPEHIREDLGTHDAALPPFDEVLTLKQCIAAYTIGGAKMLGIDKEVGTIEVGKKADMILLNQNLFKIDPVDIPKTKVLATMFDGKLVHDVTYGIGDSETVDLPHVGEGAVGPCSHEVGKPKGAAGHHDHQKK